MIKHKIYVINERNAHILGNHTFISNVVHER